MSHLRSGYVVADMMDRWNMANVKAGSREDRLKAALRENLKRRKAQARGRQGVDPGAEADRDAGVPENHGSEAPKGRPD